MEKTQEEKDELKKQATTDKQMDEQIREATIKSVIKTLMNLSTTEVIVYDETMKSDLRRMANRTNEYIEKLECEFRAEQQVQRQLLETIMESQMNIVKLCDKILKSKTKKRKQ
jgi:hypothetical protein